MLGGNGGLSIVSYASACQYSPHRHPFNARGNRRHVVPAGRTDHESRGAQSQDAPSMLGSEPCPQLALGHLSRRVRNSRVEGKAQQIISAAGGERGGEVMCKAVALGRTELVVETGVNHRAERSWELGRMKRVADAELD